MATSVEEGMHSAEWYAANTSRQLYAATSTIMFICTVLLALRIYARSLTRGERGWDDFFLVASWIFLMGLCILLFVAIPRTGIGRHLPAVLKEDPHIFVTWNLVIYLLDWFYVPTNLFSRLSVVALYLRIFAKQRTWYFCWVVGAFLTATCVAFLITANFECIPLQRAWDKSVPGRCFDLQLWWKLSTIPNVIVDFAMLLLPMRKVWELKATRAKKMGIALVCLTGSIGLFASCMRTANFFSTLAIQPPDPTWTSSPLLVWTVVESGMYNAAACLICLRPLYGKVPRFIRKRLKWNTSNKSSDGDRRYALTTIGSRGPDKWWIKMDADDVHSTANMVQAQGRERIEDIELVKPQPVRLSGGISTLDRIKVDRSFDVVSTTASEGEASSSIIRS